MASKAAKTELKKMAKIQNRRKVYRIMQLAGVTTVSEWKGLVRLLIPEPHRRRIEKLNTHLGGVEVTKFIEFRIKGGCGVLLTSVVATGIRAFLTNLLCWHQ